MSRNTHGTEGAFNLSKWNLYLEWRLLHSRDLTARGSALLDALARQLLGYRKSRGEIGRALLMEMSGIDDGRNFNHVRDELEALGLGVSHDGKGVGTRTVYDLGPLLAEALTARNERRLKGRLSPLPKSRGNNRGNDVSSDVDIDVSRDVLTTSPETPRIEKASPSSKDVSGGDISDRPPQEVESAPEARPSQTVEEQSETACAVPTIEQNVAPEAIATRTALGATRAVEGQAS